MTTDRWSFENHNLLVTGATRGIGAAIVDEFLELGARVLFVARNQKDVTARESEWRERGLDARGLAADVATRQGRARLAEQVSAWSDRLDALVNNVGTNIRKPASRYSEDEFDAVFKTNLDERNIEVTFPNPLISDQLPVNNDQ